MMSTVEENNSRNGTCHEMARGLTIYFEVCISETYILTYLHTIHVGPGNTLGPSWSWVRMRTAGFSERILIKFSRCLRNLSSVNDDGSCKDMSFDKSKNNKVLHDSCFDMF